MICKLKQQSTIWKLPPLSRKKKTTTGQVKKQLFFTHLKLEFICDCKQAPLQGNPSPSIQFNSLYVSLALQQEELAVAT
jgi:hypothetical protein